MAVHGAPEGIEVVEAGAGNVGESKEGVETVRVTTGCNCEVALGTVEPSVEGSRAFKVGGRFPSTLARVVEPPYTELEAMSSMHAFRDNHVNSILRGGTSWGGPRVIGRVGGGKAMGACGAYATAQGQSDMHIGWLAT